MPTNQFLNLEAEKQNRIIQAAITEFAQNTYVNASTNRIVKACGISKGSLFKYFTDKEDLYFFLLDTVMWEMLRDIESDVENLSTELFQRIIDYSALEISWYIKNPDKGRLIMSAVTEKDEEICSRIAERYGARGENIYYEMLKGIEGNDFRIGIDKIAKILKWVLEGFNKTFLEKVDVNKESFECLKKKYIQELSDYIEILKNGFVEGKNNMFWNAKNGSVKIGDTQMEYVSFGYGSKTFIVLPGLSDGLLTVKGKALLLAKPYVRFFKDYTVYMFSRKDKMPENYSIRDMAADQAKALEELGISKVSIMGYSQGGMIAQFLAIDYPKLVEKLVIAVSAPRVNDIIHNAVSSWIEMAASSDHKSLMIDTAEKMYSENYLKKYRKMYPIIGKVGKPRNYDRFMINAKAILSFDAYEELNKIVCPTYIIGGEEDKTVGVKASYEMNERIENSVLHIYKGLGHAPHEEAEDFYQIVYDFLEA